MLGTAGFITPVLVTFFGSIAGAVIVGLLIVGGFIALLVSSEFFRLLCGRKFYGCGVKAGRLIHAGLFTVLSFRITGGSGVT